MSATTVASGACTIVTRMTPSLALVTAAFRSQLDSPRLIVSRRPDLSDVNPSIWQGSRTVLVSDYVRHQLVGFRDPAVINFGKSVFGNGHQLVMLTDAVERVEHQPGQESDDHRRNCRRLMEILFPEHGKMGAALAAAADALAYETEPDDELARYAVFLAKERLCSASGEALSPSPTSFARAVQEIARETNVGL